MSDPREEQAPAGPTLRDPVLPDDAAALLALEDAAAGAANAFVYDDPAQAAAVRAALLERGAAEWAPPHARLLALPDDPAAGLLVVVEHEALGKRRLLTALALKRLGPLVPAAVQARATLVGSTLLRTTPGDAYLSRIAVGAAHAGRGHGRTLLDAAVARARALGAGRLVLDVADDNATARAFYARAGFADLGGAEAHDPQSGRGIAHRHLALPIS